MKNGTENKRNYHPHNFTHCFHYSSNLCYKIHNRKSEKEYQLGLQYFGNTQFKGKVVGFKKYEWAGKDYYKICVKLDYTNKKDLFIYNNELALRIKNDTAIMGAGVFNPDSGPVQYIEVNINNSHLMQLRYRDRIR